MKKHMLIFSLICFLSFSSFSNPPMFDALLSGDVGRVTELLESGKANVNAPYSYTRGGQDFRNVYPINFTSATGSMLALLLRFGANPNIVSDGDRMTPLMRAASDGRIEDVEALLSAGADPRIVFRATGWGESRIGLTARGILQRRRLSPDEIIPNAENIMAILEILEHDWDRRAPTIVGAVERIRASLWPAAVAIVGVVLPQPDNATGEGTGVALNGHTPLATVGMHGGSLHQ